MKKLLVAIVMSSFVLGAGAALAQETPAAEGGGGGGGKVKAKFYDFSDTVIDGETKRPTDLYIDAKAKVKFDRLLKLKKSFLNAMMKTSKERVLKSGPTGVSARGFRRHPPGGPCPTSRPSRPRSRIWSS